MEVSSIFGNSFNYMFKSNSVSYKKWKMTDELKTKITELAKTDANQHKYMGDKYKELLVNEYKSVGPDREALKRAAVSMMHQSNNRGLNSLEILLGGNKYISIGNEFGFGQATHYYDAEGEEVLCYTGGSGFADVPTKIEERVAQEMVRTYKAAWDEAKANRDYPPVEPSVKIDITGIVIEENSFDTTV